MSTTRTGLLIVFEGIDGTGKSTQIELLGDFLRTEGYPVITTREPTDGKYGKAIRALYVDRGRCTPEEELKLFLDDRREHVSELLTPHLERGDIILCDRYYFSTAAYQGANGFDPAEIIKRNSFAPEPDITLIFEQPVQTSLARITENRGEALNEFEQSESLSRVAEIFRSLTHPSIVRIDATDSIDQVHQSVVDAVTPFLHKIKVSEIH